MGHRWKHICDANHRPECTCVTRVYRSPYPCTLLCIHHSIYPNTPLHTPVTYYPTILTPATHPYVHLCHRTHSCTPHSQPCTPPFHPYTPYTPAHPSLSPHTPACCIFFCKELSGMCVGLVAASVPVFPQLFLGNWALQEHCPWSRLVIACTSAPSCG